MTATRFRQELASTIRLVNARHAEIGSPELIELRRAWLNLDRALALASASGDDRAVLVAVRTYRDDALAAIEEAAA